jgi:excisionase family DNA binding protein
MFVPTVPVYGRKRDMVATRYKATEALDVEKLYTVEEVAEYLALNPATVRLYLRDGELQGIKLGPRQWRVRESALEDFLEQRGQDKS